MSVGDVRVMGVGGMPEVRAGDDLPALIVDALASSGVALEDGDALVVTQKVVSKAEGRIVDLATVTPSPFALEYAQRFEKDARQVEVVLRETKRVVRMEHGVMICETHHGFVCANAGVDASNVERTGTVCLLPVDPDASARGIRDALRKATGRTVAVIVSDTFGRPWREGHVNFAIGIAGIAPVVNYAGQVDPAGYELRVTQMAVVDELAAAAELVHGKLDRVPVAVVRGVRYEPSETATSADLIRAAERDMFR
ncbi:MAG TPA: coenzyme F420-0:L-glutamate ligase [Dehalococcoidia bacterium]|nr:coenzyme F420-0:L-glutamate ligase [Dehalococcoidia bacterium]